MLGPGWGGDISDDEVSFIQDELLKDKKLAYQWGFAPSRGARRPEAIRRVALEGDPEHRNTNVSLTRAKSLPDPQTEPQPKSESEALPEIQASSSIRLQHERETGSETEIKAEPETLTLWDYAGIDVPQAAVNPRLAKAGK